MARAIALEILLKYQNEQSYLNITLNEYLKNSILSRSDKDLITRIVYGTVQNKMYLEYQLAPFIDGKKVKGREMMILLMALYQLLFLDKVPEYAIIDEAVTLAKKKDIYAGRFVNGVLRNFLRQGKREVAIVDPEKKLSIETSHPLWIIKMLTKQYDFATTKQICEHDNTPPTRAGRVNTLKTTRQNLLANKRFTIGNLSPDGILYAAGNLASTNYYKEGLLTVQDESSQLVARLLAPRETDRVLDMCCAPGSKTTHLAALMNNQGEIVAYDLFAHKLKLVQANLTRLGVKNVSLHTGDATKLTTCYEPESFDKILLDAPCSGLGVMRRKPEIKYHDSSEMDTIIPLQAKLLDNAYYLLKKDGRMVYSTCTINKKENQQMIKRFLEKYPDMKVIEEKVILPFEYDSDGFYMCKLEKGK